VILKRTQLHIREQAFSLVEVAMALGVVSVVAIPLLGLLVVGFGTMQTSNAEVRSSVIAQKIVAAAQMMPYGELTNRVYSLDFEGREVPAAEAVFRAELRVLKQPAGNIVDSPNVARVSVTIGGPAVNNEERVYSEILVNLGKLD